MGEAVFSDISLEELQGCQGSYIDMRENIFSYTSVGACEKKLCYFIVMREKFINMREIKP